MDLQAIRDSLNAEMEILKKEFCAFFEQYLECDEEADTYEAIISLDRDEIYFNDATQELKFDNYDIKILALNDMIQIIDSIIKECDNKNQMHQNKIEIEEWIREFRQMKKRSRKVIEEEESVLKLAEEKLKILEDIRTDLNNK